MELNWTSLIGHYKYVTISIKINTNHFGPEHKEIDVSQLLRFSRSQYTDIIASLRLVFQISKDFPKNIYPHKACK